MLGFHRGFWFHTVGQRKGVPLSGGPWWVACCAFAWNPGRNGGVGTVRTSCPPTLFRYVTRKDPHTNTVYVSRQYHEQDKQRSSFTCGSFAWCSSRRPDPARPLHCKVRHGPHLYGCRLELEGGEAASGRVFLDDDDQGLAAGQFAVFYQDGLCLGSAVISGT